jgi:LPXTG-site transpeptidase (sortase) family protein
VRRSLPVSCAVLVTAAVAFASAALGATPPNPHDPCVKDARNICGTTGVGYYKTYSYGTRWFGDFKDAIPGTQHTFCIDLRFWYPGVSYAYKEDTSGTLRNKAGEVVPLPNRERIAYAIWTYGRSTIPDQQAAVMLYVHGQMGDARPGEVSPTVLGPNVASIYAKVDRDATRFHGPYRIDANLPAGLKVSTPSTATVRVLAASGLAIPNLQLTVAATGATGVPKTVQTDASGTAKIGFTPAGGPLKLTVTASTLPSTFPRVFAPTSAAAAANGQRLALPAAQTISDSQTATPTRTTAQVSTAAKPTVLAVGESSADTVTISSTGTGWKGTVQVKVYGPFRTTDSIACTGPPASQSTFSASGKGTFTTAAFKPSKPGWYVYQEVVPGDAGTIGLTTPCNVASERFQVQVQPKVVTTVSSQTTAPGASVTDTVKVSGLLGEHATVQAALYGPFGSTKAIVCTGTPVWTGTIDVPADGTYTTQPFTPTVAGYYTYHETIAAAGFVRAAKTTCADTAETTVLPGKPSIVTQVSNQNVAPGSTITDKAVVSGLGGLEATVTVDLYGPFATRGSIACTGTPYWRGSFLAKGDGTYTTAKVTVKKAGYYTYREAIAGSTANSAFTSPCAETAETTFAHSIPTLATSASSEVVKPGASVSDKVTVHGLGSTAAVVQVVLYGPFAERSVIGCTGTPAGTTQFTAKGDGTYTSPTLLVHKVGFYVFREQLVGNALVTPVDTKCEGESEVTLVAPEIITGRGDVTHEVRVRAQNVVTPTRVQVGSVNIDAPVLPVGIAVGQGVLGVSPDIHHTGWWKDGAAPGDKTGAVLIAGHVDSATQGAGAFFNLKNAKAGDKVVITASGRTYSYRVTSVKNYLKSKLPTDVWSRHGPARLVLVTCGGAFDQKTKHYVDNVVLTAVPG